MRAMTSCEHPNRIICWAAAPRARSPKARVLGNCIADVEQLEAQGCCERVPVFQDEKTQDEAL